MDRVDWFGQFIPHLYIRNLFLCRFWITKLKIHYIASAISLLCSFIGRARGRYLLIAILNACVMKFVSHWNLWLVFCTLFVAKTVCAYAGCNQTCTVEHDQAVCGCQKGFDLAENGKDCVCKSLSLIWINTIINNHLMVFNLKECSLFGRLRATSPTCSIYFILLNVKVVSCLQYKPRLHLHI